MQGLNMGDIFDERDKLERANLLGEFNEKQNAEDLSDLSSISDASMALDKIIMVKNKDPKIQKPGQETRLKDEIFEKFVTKKERSTK